MRGWFIFLAVFGILWAIWYSWFGRYTTNTAGGRFYKNDRWTGETLVVEKNGYTHLLAQSSNQRDPSAGGEISDTSLVPSPKKRKSRTASTMSSPRIVED